MTRIKLFLISTGLAILMLVGYYYKEFGNLSMMYSSSLSEKFQSKKWKSGQGQSIVVEKTCEPQHHIMFMKTHKTASTTLQNIVFRYVDKNNLQLGLSDSGPHFHYHIPFKKEFILKTKRPIEVLGNHMTFNYKEVQSVLPNDTKYFTLMRKPSSLFESLFDYMHADSASFARIKRGPHALEEWLNNPNKYFKKDSYWWFAKNAMFHDLGFDSMNEDESYIKQSITDIENQFDLVLITDYFMESMILLKDILCWDYEDILFVKNYARSKKSTNITADMKKKIKDWNKSDTAIYDHFNKTLWRKVEEYGFERMKNDVEHLRKMNEELKDFCIEGDAVSNEFIKDKNNKLYNPSGFKMMGYNLKQSARSNRTCVNLIKAELPFISEFKKRLADEMKDEES